MDRYRWRVGHLTGGGSGPPPRIFFAIFLLVGLGLLGGSIYLTFDTRRALAEGTRVEGEVIELLRSRDSDGDVTYRPHVRFTTLAGDTLEFTSTMGSNPAAFDVGERVVVIYNPASPRDARIDSFFQLWFAPLLLGGMGIVFTAVGCLAFQAGRRPAEPAEPAEPLSDVAESEPAMTRAVERRSRD